MMLRRACAALVGAASFGAVAQPVVQPGEEKLTVMLGVFLPAFESRFRIDNDQLGNGSRVDLGEDLGVDQDTSGGWFGAEWRFAPRHRLGFTYSRFTLSGERTAQRDLQIGDEVFPAGATVSSRLRLAIAPITYSYSVLKRPHDELALTVGLHWSSLSFRVQGSASLGAQDATHESTARANVPLPLFGLRYDHHFSERWSAGASAAAFALRFGKEEFEFEGDLWSVRLHAEYRFARNYSVGAALDGFKVSVEASQKKWKGGFDYSYWGPQIYLNARF